VAGDRRWCWSRCDSGAWHLGQPHHDLGECRAELLRSSARPDRPTTTGRDGFKPSAVPPYLTFLCLTRANTNSSRAVRQTSRKPREDAARATTHSAATVPKTACFDTRPCKHQPHARATVRPEGLTLGMIIRIGGMPTGARAPRVADRPSASVPAGTALATPSTACGPLHPRAPH
jgi:hypothetical protein